MGKVVRGERQMKGPVGSPMQTDACRWEGDEKPRQA